MSKGPQTYPGANTTAAWFQDNYPGSSMEVNVGVIHTTEGTSLPSYGGGGSAPTMTLVPDFKAKKLKAYQHFPIDKSGRALVNRSGGVETNTLNVFQVELVGTCDPSTSKKWGGKNTSHIFWPEAPDWALREVAKLFAWLEANHGIPLSCGVSFKAYPSSYGSNGVRMSNAKWNGYKGWCGHQHVPENDHGDPGNFPIAKVLEYAKGGAPATPKPTTPKPPTKPAPKPKPPAKPVVDLSNLIAAARRDPGLKQGGTTHAADVRIVEDALRREGLLSTKYASDGSFGSTTVTAYAAWQRRLGYQGKGADGIPGSDSLKRLGTKYGFTVKA
ncbi:endolysin [Streptomyces phage Celia]|uniref:LysM-like endolysin n=1 Tax=Streptomyces phage Celia TaxID=2590946 RepID=A0A516KRA8_9CAUD|nr:endolysin [Streptomyces phage Celia]QDP44231.1 LysM-like endolysin [Streptomyces phage Celia]QFG10491.1 lysin A, N-acetylmuramoyl-L-alanine amidase domain [Streptomyces phage Urza]QJD50593.1 endolysin [Streptomyces phage Itza]